MKTETKTMNLFARAMMMLVLMMLTAATAWAQNPLYLSLDKNDGSGEAATAIPVNYDYLNGGYHYTLSATYYTRDGHSIIGWNTSPTRAGTNYDPSATITMTESMTLYAIWDDFWETVPEASYELSPTAYTLAGAGYTDITCTLTSLVLGPIDYDMAKAIKFNMNGGTLSDDNGHSIAFQVDNPSHNDLGDWYVGDELSSQGEQFVVAVYIDPDVFAAATPGTYTGTLTYGIDWILYNGGFSVSYDGSIALTLVVPDATYSLTANQAPDGNYWATFYCGDAGYTIDDGENACAYTATYSDGKLTLHNQGKTIAKGEAVIIVADNNEVSMTKGEDGTKSADNDLHGVDVRTACNDISTTGTFYVMGKQGDEFGFFEYTAEYMPARKAYLLLNGSHQALARSLTMVFGGDETGIKSLSADSTDAEADGAWYSLDGRRLSGKPTKSGVYINNGRKIVIK